MGEPSRSPTPSTLPEELLPYLKELTNPAGLTWFDEHAAELRREAYGQHFVYWSLAIGFVVGLLAHVAGYVIRLSPPTEPLGLLADLLYALGFALWTGVVVVVFVQIVPDAKRRQLSRALAAYDAIRRARPRPTDNGDLTAT